MGRNRIRRGYSLEVIFEEDTEFCSNLDSLDSVAIRFGVKEPDETLSIDSLVEEYQIRFEDKSKDHVFRSLDGIWDIRGMDTCFVEWDEFTTETGDLTKIPPGGDLACEFDPTKHPHSRPQNGRRSRFSRRQIVEANWLSESAEEPESSIPENKEGSISPPHQKAAAATTTGMSIDIRLPKGGMCDTVGETLPTLFADSRNCRMTHTNDNNPDNEALDSYLSTRTEDLDGNNAYTFADSENFETASVASTAYDSSSSSSSSSESVRNLTQAGKKDKTKQLQTQDYAPQNQDTMRDPEFGTTDVKKVRALFEIKPASRKSSVGDESTSSTGSGRIYSKNPSSPTNNSSNGCAGGVHKKLKQMGSQNNINYHESVNKVLRSAYSQFNMNKANEGTGMDFSELLVNDKIVIEDSSIDPCRTSKHRRHNKENRRKDGFSTLRRSQSMGTGLAAIEASLFSGGNSTTSSRTNILAEEMPAPDTVKNVRTVFEQILKSRNANDSFSIVKKSLSSVRSCPSSKIYRSESMREDFPYNSASSSLCRRFGKPILMNESKSSITSHSCTISPLSPTGDSSKWKHNLVERKTSQPIKFSPKINGVVRPPDKETVLTPMSEDESSLMSSINDDDNPPKFVSPDVLQRIRSCGSSTTYFGGQVIAHQTLRSRRHLPVSRRHTIVDFKEFSNAFAEECYSSTSNSNRTTPAATPTPSTLSESISPSCSSRHETDEYFTPPLIPTPTQEHLRLNSFELLLEGDQVFVPKPKLLPRRISPELEDVFTLGSTTIDTTPRIISVVPKSPSSSPTKSGSPASSVIEGRRTPEGSEGSFPTRKTESAQDGNNNMLVEHKQNCREDLHKEEIEGAWF